MPRATTCGSANTASTGLIGPAGMPALSSASENSVRKRFPIATCSKGISSARFTTRDGLVRYRSSSARPARPSTSHSLANCLSLPTATITSPSSTLNAW
jgi:hypothetical protein